MLDGIVTSYYPDGRVEFEKKFDMGMEISYTSFDSLGNKDYWLKSLTQSDIPTFKKEFIQIVGSNDSGLVVNLSVPGISPFQILPVTKNANWKSIDIKKGDWLIMSKGDSIELGIGIKMTESTFFFMDYFKPVIISEIP